MPTNYLKGYTLDGSTRTEYEVDESFIGGGEYLPTGSFFTVNPANPEQGNNYQTIGAAIAAAGANQVILVYPGTYAESIALDNNIKVHGLKAAQTVNETGRETYFGTEQPDLPLGVSLSATYNIEGAAPASTNITFTQNIDIAFTNNRLAPNATDERAFIIRVPYNMDTSRKVSFRAAFRGTSGTAGDIRWRFRYAKLTDGDFWNGSLPDQEVLFTQTFSLGANQSDDVTFEFWVPDAVPGDMIVCKFGRLGPDVADTYTGNVDLGLLEAIGTAWTN